MFYFLVGDFLVDGFGGFFVDFFNVFFMVVGFLDFL